MAENPYYRYYVYSRTQEQEQSKVYRETHTTDIKLKKVVDKFVDVYGAIWYLEHLYEKKVIDKEQLLQAYEIWLNDDMVYMPNDILLEKIEKIKQTD